jgi:hypothetical protein
MLKVFCSQILYTYYRDGMICLLVHGAKGKLRIFARTQGLVKLVSLHFEAPA